MGARGYYRKSLLSLSLSLRLKGRQISVAGRKRIFDDFFFFLYLFLFPAPYPVCESLFFSRGKHTPEISFILFLLHFRKRSPVTRTIRHDFCPIRLLHLPKEKTAFFPCFWALKVEKKINPRHVSRNARKSFAGRKYLLLLFRFFSTKVSERENTVHSRLNERKENVYRKVE